MPLASASLRDQIVTGSARQRYRLVLEEWSTGTLDSTRNPIRSEQTAHSLKNRRRTTAPIFSLSRRAPGCRQAAFGLLYPLRVERSLSRVGDIGSEMRLVGRGHQSDIDVVVGEHIADHEFDP